MLRPVLTIISFALAGNLVAQGAGEFVADELIYDAEAKTVDLVGSVEIETEAGYFYVDYLHYDIASGQIQIDGQMQAVAADGTLAIAQFATLDPETQYLVLRQARALLENNVQFAAAYYERDTGYDYGEGVLASSCNVCIVRPTPLWQVRAEQVYLDRDADKIYVKNGRFEIVGVPVMALPHMRFPGPEGTAIEGFLPPEFIFSDRFLSGVEIPYYWILGDHGDLKINTKITTDDILVSDFRWRQYVPYGSVTIDGGYLFRDGENETDRKFIEGTFDFSFPNNFDFDARYSYASDYDFQPDFNFGKYSTDTARLTQYDNDSRFSFELTQYRPASEAEKDDNIQTLRPYFDYDTTLDLSAGWSLDLGVSALWLDQSLEDDYQQFLASSGISRTDILPGGVVSELDIGASWRVSRGEAIIDEETPTASEFRPYINYSLAWPLISAGANTTQHLTPRLDIFSTQSIGFNDFESASVNFAGADDYVGLFTNDIPNYGLPFDNATKINLGFDYRVDFARGDAFEFALGRSISFDNDAASRSREFSEWVGYANYENERWSFQNRFGFDDDLKLTRFETGLGYDGKKSDFEVNWLQLVEDSSIGIDAPISELELAGNWRVHQNWELDYGLYYDLENTEPFDASLGLVYGNECIEVQAGAEWDFDKGEGIADERSLSLSVKFLGLTASATDKWGTRQCR